MLRCSPSPPMTLRAILALQVLCLAVLISGCATITRPTQPISAIPVKVVQGKGPGDVLALWYSGDAGWGPTDRAIAAGLAARGVTVVGVSSSRYFWHGRSVEAAAADLEALVASYTLSTGRPKLILVGYSFGGALLPLVEPRLAPQTRARIGLIAMVAPSRKGQLVVRPWTWLDIFNPSAVATREAAPAMAPARVICIYGVRDHGAACPELAGATVTVLPSGHLFEGQTDVVAAAIAAAAGIAPAS